MTAPADPPSPGFWQLAAHAPERPALVDPDGRVVSAGELLASANQVVHGLRALGFEPGDVVAMLLPNCTEVFELLLAVTQAGFYLVPVNTHLVGPEIAYIVGDSEAKVFVAHARFAASAVAALAELDLPPEGCFAVGGEIAGFRPFAELTAGQPTTTPSDRQTGLIMNYTSGTTGRPKGIRRPLSGLEPDERAGKGGQLGMFGVRPFDDNVHLVGSPTYHTAVLGYAGPALHFGHTVVVMDGWTPEDMLRVIDEQHITHTHMVPTQFVRLLALPDDVRARYDVSSLRHVLHAAAPCPPDVKRQMLEWWGPVIDEYYGASEGGGTYVLAADWLEHPGTVGQPWPLSKVTIVDDDGNELGPNQLGTVYMVMGSVAPFEYHHAKEKTAESHRGEFFTVGDIGFLDEDGWLFLSDRKADVIISGGANIYPAEVENQLIMHPKVGDVAVFGIPDADWGEAVKAVVEPIAGVEGSAQLEQEILEWSATRLAKFKRPRTIDFTSALPRDPNGKLYKRKLRDPYWEGRERAI
jgi:long-chain acyl-CoA synthetase